MGKWTKRNTPEYIFKQRKKSKEAEKRTAVREEARKPKSSKGGKA